MSSLIEIIFFSLGFDFYSGYGLSTPQQTRASNLPKTENNEKKIFCCWMLHVSIYCDFIHFTQKKKKKGGKKGKKKKVILK